MEHSFGNHRFAWLLFLLCVFGSCPWSICKKPDSNMPQATLTRFPWCITKETLQEYELDLPEGHLLYTDKLKKGKPYKSSKCPTCPVGFTIDRVKYYRIETNLDRNFMFEYMHQWMHIHVQTNTPLQGLVVQANVAPYAMAYGVFDLEFGCTDCQDGIDLEATLTGNALALGGKAAAIPCRRRTYLHIRHPYVYAYAHKEGSTSFHFNYKYLDITCRKTDMIQFMFLMIPVNGRISMGKTSVIDHRGADSYDGMPYPFHVDHYRQFTCHAKPIPLENAANGDTMDLSYLDQYYQCTLASPSKFKKNYRDNKNFISNKVCKWPERSKCDYNNDTNKVKVDPSNFEVCTVCDDNNNHFSREAYRRLIRRTYMVRRVHGVSMIFGMVALGVITIHISRYLKETGGGCLLVGWWLWAHAGLTHAAKGAVYIGLVLGLCQPDREATDEIYEIEEKRIQLIKVHKIVGAIAVILLHVECITGPIRPTASTLRSILIIVHVVVGYLSVIVAFVATIFSTACFDVVLYTILIMVISLIIWIVGTVLQILVDSAKKLSPARKMFPVIEAVKVTQPIPMKIPRLALLGVLVVLTMVFVLFMSFKGGYKGIIFSNPCANCIWKYDDTVVINKNRTAAATAPMYDYHKCNMREGMWDSLLSLPRSQVADPEP